jgi:hypothetical protein
LTKKTKKFFDKEA